MSRLLRIGVLAMLVPIAAGAEPNIEKLASRCAQGKSKDCAKLVEFATSRDALGCRDCAQRLESAVGLLTDQALLRTLAEDGAGEGLRLAAIAKVDQAGLAAIAMSSSLQVRAKARDRLTDQALLLRVAQSTSADSVRRELVERITDQAALAELARTSADPLLLRNLAKRLTEPTALAELVERPEADYLAAATAIDKLADQSILARIARNNAEMDLRVQAVRRLTDQAALERVVRSDDCWLVRTLALERLAEPDADLSNRLLVSALEPVDSPPGCTSDFSRIDETRLRAISAIAAKGALQLSEEARQRLTELRPTLTGVWANATDAFLSRERPAWSQLHVESGLRVLDLESDLPLQHLATVPPGRYTVMLEYRGYTDRSVSSRMQIVTVDAGRCYTYDAGLDLATRTWSPTFKSVDCAAANP